MFHVPFPISLTWDSTAEWSGKRALIDVNMNVKEVEGVKNRRTKLSKANLKKFLIIIKVTNPSVDVGSVLIVRKVNRKEKN